MSLTLPGVKPIKRIYPHVEAITDPAAQQSTKLAWDRIHSLEERLQAAEAATTALADAHNTNLTAIAVAKTTADNALAIAQQPSLSAAIGTAGSGSSGPGAPAPGLPGSQSTPIIAMSIVPAEIAASVRASLAFFGLPATADQYWIDHASVAGQFSNGKWYQGWNAYWEARAAPGNSGSADPNLGGLPSVHQ